MNDTEARNYLLRMKHKYKLLRLIEVCLISISINLVVFGLCQILLVPSFASYGISIGAGVLFFIFRCIQLNISKIGANELVSYVNQHYSQLEESADLLLKEDTGLTPLQQIQKLKTIQQFKLLYPSIKLPNTMGLASIIFVLSILCYVALSSFTLIKKGKLIPLKENKSDYKVVEKLPSFIKRLTISIRPPVYTGIPESLMGSTNIKIAQGSVVHWRIVFEGEVMEHKIIFSGKDSVNLEATNRGYETRRSFTESGFYQFAWSDARGKQYSEFYKIEVVKDLQPTITIENLNPFTELEPTDNLKINLKSILTDDYSVKQAYIIATVSKGSGESVKFREEKLFFDSPDKIDGKQVRAIKLIDLIKLGLEPGDELYFYIEAFDNQSPIAGHNRTDTYFIALQDTAQQETSVDAGIGVELMPEYFRSQRQIIIDTEKLLKDSKLIAKLEFNSKSNALGYDQKVLRLKYGEFVGEEFEAGIAQSSAKAEGDDHASEDVLKNFGHVHDEENEHNLIAEKKTAETSHDHGNIKSNPNKKENPLDEFMHTHDSEEEATFFTQSIKAKLKAALTIMWDAELYLRLYDPAKSLPYQYKALKLLKEISQDSRVYVHRSGFDPPPLKEDKRLTADLSEIENSTYEYQRESIELYPNIKKAGVVIDELLLHKSTSITPSQKSLFIKSGQELAGVALNQPGKYLKSLSLLHALTENKIGSDMRLDALKKIRMAFWSVLPHESTSTQGRSQTLHALDQSFIRNLAALKNK